MHLEIEGVSYIYRGREALRLESWNEFKTLKSFHFTKLVQRIWSCGLGNRKKSERGWLFVWIEGKREGI